MIIKLVQHLEYLILYFFGVTMKSWCLKHMLRGIDNL